MNVILRNLISLLWALFYTLQSKPCVMKLNTDRGREYITQFIKYIFPARIHLNYSEYTSFHNIRIGEHQHVNILNHSLRFYFTYWPLFLYHINMFHFIYFIFFSFQHISIDNIRIKSKCRQFDPNQFYNRTTNISKKTKRKKKKNSVKIKPFTLIVFILEIHFTINLRWHIISFLQKLKRIKTLFKLLQFFEILNYRLCYKLNSKYVSVSSLNLARVVGEQHEHEIHLRILNRALIFWFLSKLVFSAIQ